MESIEFHEAASIFPLDEEHLDELAADIKETGLQVSIETLGGKIIDGRRRYMACEKAGVQPRYREVKVVDPVAYVVSLNLHRRHLTPSQLSMVAARATVLRDKLSAEAKQRMSNGGGDKKSRTAKSGKENLPDPIADAGQSRDQTGKLFGVSGKTVDHATRVLKTAVPEVIKAVDDGRMAVSTAAILSVEPEDVQRSEASGPKRRRKYTSGPNGTGEPEPEQPEEEEPTNGKPQGVGVIRANEAINHLTRIPKNDRLRKRGFQIVTDWIRHNR